MYTVLLALILSQVEQPLEAKFSPTFTPQKATIVDNTQVESTQITLEVDKAKLEELEKLGNVIEVVTVVQDKYPKPELEIVAPDNVPLGELIELVLSPNIPESVTKVDTTWKVLEIVSDGKNWKWNERNQKVTDNGKSCFFGAGVNPNRFLVIANVTYLYEDGPNFVSTSRMLSKEVVVGDSPGPTPVPPQPNPKPVEPTFPDGMFKISEDIYKEIKDKMTPEQAAKLVEIYKTSISQIGTGEWGDPTRAISRNNDDDTQTFLKVLSDHKTRTQQAFASANLPIPAIWIGTNNVVTTRLLESFNNDKINQLSKLSTYYGEVITALSEIK